MDAKDYEIVKMLKQDCTYKEIIDKVHVSKSRISKLKKSLSGTDNSTDSTGTVSSRSKTGKFKIPENIRKLLIKIVIKSTHYRTITQQESRVALDYLYQI